MKPSLLNYALAHTFALCGTIGMGCSVGLMIAALEGAKGALPLDWEGVVFLAIAAVAAAALGWIFGIMVLWPFLGFLARKYQGAPFHAGDSVWILTGRHKGTLAKVYEVWEERGEVRVDLGAEPKEKVADVFCTVAVCRLKPNQS